MSTISKPEEALMYNMSDEELVQYAFCMEHLTVLEQELLIRLERAMLELQNT